MKREAAKKTCSRHMKSWSKQGWQRLATTLTTDRQQVTTLLVVYGIKFHSNLLENTRSVFFRIKWSIFNIGKNSSENKSILLSYWVIATQDVIFGL